MEAKELTSPWWLLNHGSKLACCICCIGKGSSFFGTYSEKFMISLTSATWKRWSNKGATKTSPLKKRLWETEIQPSKNFVSQIHFCMEYLPYGKCIGKYTYTIHSSHLGIMPHHHHPPSSTPSPQGLAPDEVVWWHCYLNLARGHPNTLSPNRNFCKRPQD